MATALNDLPDVADGFTKCGARTERKHVREEEAFVHCFVKAARWGLLMTQMQRRSRISSSGPSVARIGQLS